MVYASSLAVLEAERSDPNAHITNFGDAVWWSITTITTVGYGDFYPVTAKGRLVAVLLMIGGISLIGMITATVATWIVHRVAEQDGTQQAATAAQIEELRSQIAQLTTLVAANQRQESREPAREHKRPSATREQPNGARTYPRARRLVAAIPPPASWGRR